ncbi:TIGR04282 family arsenosugar biosynthesis glycosyltransferase [Leptospira wolffii]|uniref:TIGR04282 family arsenosugar biosynthesis glycosyltransferase n=1 Tax=Leptospira wolffii TaxID=409998 RepID=A0ABV5BTU1_9LEPT|nr:TIGR04282 family arsenosugar biosynthesis glycosyltransferase [Leptospira wolffii]TGL55361.1 glycosyltransferase [Leptospira wolffii]
MTGPNLHVFLKNPIPGNVKTRLAKDIGEEAALEVYQALVDKTQAACKGLDLPKTLWFDSFLPNPSELGSWGHSPLFIRLQQGKDLGEKMRNSFLYSFQSGASSAVLIGSDCPELDTLHLKEAFQILEHKDVVLGPAKDGGYYLVGLRSDTPELFHGIEWSTDTVFSRSLEKMQWARKQVGLLPVLSDLDDSKDLEYFESNGLLDWRKNGT